MALIDELWSSVPPITRTILLLSIILTGAVSLDLCTPLKLYFNYNLIKYKFQFWRIFTCLFYYGEFSVDTIFDFFILYKYSIMLEKESFRNKPADFIVFFLFGSLLFIVLAIFFGFEFLSPCISSMMLYLWCRRNSTFNINFLEIFNFRAPFLPWVLMTFLLMFGFNPIFDVIGVGVGHIYYFLEDVVPKIPETRDFRLLKPPQFLIRICDAFGIHNYALNNEDFIFEDDQNAGGAGAVGDIREDVLIDENNEDENRLISTYYDHEGERIIRKKPDSIVRSLQYNYLQQRSKDKKLQNKVEPHKLFMMSLFFETVFYIPNRFRSIVLLNTQTVVYTQTDQALLSLMSIMFNMQKQQELSLSVKQFFSSFKFFFSSTMLYESMSICLRFGIFEKLQSDQLLNQHSSPEINGFIAGTVAQTITSPLFKLSLANHNYRICDSQSLKEFYRQALTTNQGKQGFLTIFPISLAIRGGILGMLQQGLFFRVAELLEEPIRLPNDLNINSGSHKSKIDHFITSVKNDNEIIEKLYLTGFFDEIIYDQNFKPPRQYKNLLITGIGMALLQSIVMTPIDILVFNQMQMRMYGPKALQKVSLSQVIKELKYIQGLPRIGTMIFASSFVRNLFIVSGFYISENYLRSKLIKE